MIYSQWFTECKTEEEKQDLEKTLKNATYIFRKLYQIIHREEQELLASQFTMDDFNTPNWAEKQAFRNGELSRCRKLKKLLSFAT